MIQCICMLTNCTDLSEDWSKSHGVLLKAFTSWQHPPFVNRKRDGCFPWHGPRIFPCNSVNFRERIRGEFQSSARGEIWLVNVVGRNQSQEDSCRNHVGWEAHYYWDLHFELTATEERTHRQRVWEKKRWKPSFYCWHWLVPPCANLLFTSKKSLTVSILFMHSYFVWNIRSSKAGGCDILAFADDARWMLLVVHRQFTVHNCVLYVKSHLLVWGKNF